MRSCLELNATMVANEFIDRCMVSANGEYVKVYLYILRHQGRIKDLSQIADALEHTEADVKRAVGYWVKQGVLEEPGQAVDEPEISKETAGREQAASRQPAEGVYKAEQLTISEEISGDGKETPVKESRRLYTPEQVSRLADQEDFTQLLYISQKYMNKVFTPRECEVFAYLYDGLRMPAEVLEYLVEYCVQGGHYSIRYLESVALNWHEKGITTVDMARGYTSAFSKEGFAVMRAFGISDRRPGQAEQELIRKWFKEFGFTKDIVLEACSRTLKAIHKPSFSYADKILSEWKKGGVRVLADVAKMDEKRDNKRNDRTQGPVKPAKNQFHNFEQRNTNYDAVVLERLKERLGEHQG
ncbi:MAG: DnaD domain protein [Hungatella sp.]|nr:DnaD domain protein [Hungatella sp.]